MLIDEVEKENHGQVATEVALEMAKERGYDLVEVSPKVSPPVCKIMDYSKFKYLTAKKEKKAKSKNKQKEMKEMRFPVHIDQGDIGHKIRRVREFLQKGHNVRINIYLKGRINPGQEVDLMNNILTELKEECKIEQSPKKEGRNYGVIVIPVNNAKDKNTQSIKETI